MLFVNAKRHWLCGSHWGWISSLLGPVTLKAEQLELSYGQLMSTFSIIPVFISFIDNAQRRCSWRKVKEFFPSRCSAISKGICFIITGKKDWTDRHPELDRSYLSWPKHIWVVSEHYIAPSSYTVDLSISSFRMVSSIEPLFGMDIVLLGSG